jgi:uncharacterized membrane protein
LLRAAIRTWPAAFWHLRKLTFTGLIEVGKLAMEHSILHAMLPRASWTGALFREST